LALIAENYSNTSDNHLGGGIHSLLVRTRTGTKSVTIAAKVPPRLYELLKVAKDATGAVSLSDLVRDALRSYLANLTFSEELLRKAKEELRRVSAS
jgi:hypothetical protein